MADNPTVNGVPVAGDDVGGGIIVQRIKLNIGPDGTGGSATDVHSGLPLPVAEGLTYAYDAGVDAATVDVPAAALLRRVAVLAGASGVATITIGAGDTITIPASGTFDEQIPGRAVGADVVIGGDVEAYYVAWVA